MQKLQSSKLKWYSVKPAFFNSNRIASARSSRPWAPQENSQIFKASSYFAANAARMQQTH